MGFDTHIVYILYGICIDSKDMKNIKINIIRERPKQRKFKVVNTNKENTNYFMIDYGNCWYLALKSISYGLGENDFPPEQPCIIEPPTEEEVVKFKEYLTENNLNYTYNQYFLN
jgi:hypothetical protein